MVSRIRNRVVCFAVSVGIFWVGVNGFTSSGRGNIVRKYSTTRREVSTSSSLKHETAAVETLTPQDLDLLYLLSLPQNGASPLSQPPCEKRRQFELKLGKAIDTLKKDYPNILKSDPDFSIYDESIEVIDPAGVKLHSLNNYKGFFSLMHTVVNLFYCPQKSGIVFRQSYDWARKNIRVSWNVVLTPRLNIGGNNELHVDGISVYEMDEESGLLTQHRVEHLLINNSPVLEPQGIFVTMRNLANNKEGPEGIPVLNTQANKIHPHPTTNLKFEFRPFKNNLIGRPKSVLFSEAQDNIDKQNSNSMNHPLFDKKAFDAKNKSRQRFGLKPLTPAEFVEIESQVVEMEQLQQTKANQWRSAAEMASTPNKKKSSWKDKILGGMLKDTCESNYDCVRPEVCCDLGFKKMCCSSGQKVIDGFKPNGNRALVPVVAGGGELPRGGPNGDGMRNY